jgi:histidinol dehydrogenase
LCQARDGEVNPLVLAAASLAGVSEVWRIGGAQAVAALAYGTQTIGQVDKIVGPGNAFVAAAKRQVFGQVGIDSIAGPSEILVVADAQNDPNWIAADLLSQAEHDEAAQSILITDDADFADAVEAAVQAMLPQLERAAVAGQSWADNGAIITVPSMMRCQRLQTGLRLNILNLRLMMRLAGQAKFGMQVPCSLAAIRQRRLAIMLLAQTMFCQPREPHDSHPGLALLIL